MRQSVLFQKPFDVRIQSEPVPEPKAGDLLVQTLCSAVSAGTELLVYRGQLPSEMTVDATIDALGQQETYPLKYGYSLVGEVIKVGSGVGSDWIGRHIFAFQPHESHFCISAAAAIPVPEGIDPEDAVFLPNMETAVSFVMDGQPVIGERVLVLGQGVVGLLTTAILSRYPLDQLVTVDGIEGRRKASAAWGASARDLDNLVDIIDFDLAYELSGNPAALNTAIERTGFDGRIVIGSWYGTKRASINLGGSFHRSHIRIISSQVSFLNPRWQGRWTKSRRLDTAWAMIRELQPSRLISHRFPVAQAAECYELLDRRADEALQVLFNYSR